MAYSRLTEQVDQSSQQKFAVEKETTSTNIPFIENAMEMLDSFSPLWRHAEQQMETLCYPACLDVLKNRVIVIDAKTSSNVAGQTGEDLVSALFQRLNMGGVVIGGFDSEDFYGRLMKENKKQFPSSARKALRALLDEMKKKYGSRVFECDFLFYHAVLGLCIVEVKAAVKVDVINMETFDKAQAQVSRLIESQFFQRVAEIFTGREMALSFPVRGVIFFPFADLSHVEKELQGNFEIEVIDRRQATQDPFNRFWQKWLERMEQTEENQSGLQYADNLQFIAGLIGYRSAVHVSACRCILEVHKMVSEGDFFAKNDPKRAQALLPADNQYDGTIFLTPEQLAIMDCRKKIQIIYGPPGTGKTLLLLLKALKTYGNNANLNSRTLAVEARTESLRYKFEKFFKSNCAGSENEACAALKPVLTFLASHNAEVIAQSMPEEYDDYFADECGEKEIKTIFERRCTAEGTTVIVVTGNDNAAKIYEKPITELITEFGLIDYEFFHLKKSLRGTRNITRHWKKYSREWTRCATVGHFITGPVVEKRRVPVSKVVDELIAIVKSLFNETATCLQPKDIAILKIQPRAFQFNIKKKLRENAIPCGSIMDQLMNSSLVAVDDFLNALSHEWPVVIVVFDSGWKSDLAVATSRAMVRLIILTVEEEYVKLDKETRKWLSC